MGEKERQGEVRKEREGRGEDRRKEGEGKDGEACKEAGGREHSPGSLVPDAPWPQVPLVCSMSSSMGRRLI